MNQTAVEWLVNEINAEDWWYLPKSMKLEIIQQAIEMEKQQIIKHSVELCKILISNPFETSGKTPQELVDAYFLLTFKSE